MTHPFGPRSRALLAVSVAVFAAFLFNRNNQSPSASHYDPNDIKLSQSEPDVTAVLLNWVRMANVVQIVSVLCGAALDGVIKEIVVWNNNPVRPLVDEDFTNCTHKLRIHNSPENLYFQARFIACSSASTPYCFIQDDDYLLEPEIIRTLRARIDTHDIFFLPPDEILSSHLLSVDSPSTNITFGFSWLGYGALILRSNAESFLSLLKRIGASEEESKMADNYYSILKNSVPEVWTGYPTELFGGGAFTVAEQGGVARNRKHIAAAANYLDRIVADMNAGDSQWPYISLPPSHREPRFERSPCLERLCLLESTISFLPEIFATDTYQKAVEVFSREAQLSPTLTEQFTSNYVNFPLSRAVDADPNTFFRSSQDAAQGDTLVLDIFDGVQQMNWTGVEWLWLVDTDMAPVLEASAYSFSSDKRTWVESSGSVSCTTFSPQISASSSSTLECHVPIEGPSLDSARYFRLQLRKATFTVPWRIYETWLRGVDSVVEP
ncbi:hypothetical protein B0H19DRAFT_1177471 [Mycena capillaripes]|nr:hypothetical protein B0H19DRAFT_1177471 [Mycena capillaripes]